MMKKTIKRVFEESFSQYSKNIFITDKNLNVTYKTLRNSIRAKSEYLHHKGIIAKRVIVYLERSRSQLEAELSVLYSGNTYIPIDKSTPINRVRFIVENSEADFIITDNQSFQDLVDTGIKLISCKKLMSKVFPTNRKVIEAETASDAYIIYTSGTTGEPKGVRISKKNFINMYMHSESVFKYTTKYTSMIMNSLSFDLSIWEVVTAMRNGGNLVMIEDDIRLDHKRLLNFIKDNSINHLMLTPSYLRGLVVSSNLFNMDMSNTITEIMSGAEKLSVKLTEKIFQVFGNKLTIINGYGPTEGSVCAFLMRVNVRNYQKLAVNGTIPIGKPFQETKFKISNCDKGGAGQLLISGKGISEKGYLKRKKENKKVFTNKHGKRWYDTGDVVQMVKGNLVYLSRNDRQVKINGYRVELEEISNVILDFDGIVDSHVVYNEDQQSGRKILFAFCVTNSDKKVDIDLLKQFCNQKLATYMRPNVFTVVDSFPTMPSGKIDEKALLSLFRSTEKNKPSTKKDFVESFKNKVKKILYLTEVDLNRSFFELGGNSMDAILLQAEVNSSLNLEISVQDIFDAKSLNSLCEKVFRPKQAENDLLKKATPFQNQIWTADNLDSGMNNYNIFLAFEIQEKLDLERFRSAFNRVHTASDLLRSSFIEKDGRVFAKITDEPLRFKIHDGSLSREEILEEIKKINAMSWNLESGPLYTVDLFKDDDGKIFLNLKFHHIIMDETGFKNYLRLVINTYLHESSVPVQEYYDANNDAESDAKWEGEILNSIQLLNLNSVNEGKRNGKTLSFRLDERHTEHVKEMAKKYNVTIFAVLLQSFGQAVGKVFNQSSFSIGLPMSTRSKIDSMNIIGPFLNTVPMIFRYNTDLVKGIKENFESYCGSLSHRNVPLANLIGKLPYRDANAENPLFNIIFSESVERYDSYLSELKASQIKIENIPPKFPLSMYFEQKQNNVDLILQYANSVISEEKINSLQEEFVSFFDSETTSIEPVENTVKEIWKEVLNIQEFSNDDNFFELGGDSIKAIKVSILLKKAGYVDFMPRAIFKYPTVSKLSNTIFSGNILQTQPQTVDNVELQSYRLSPVQEGIFWECVHNPKQKMLYHQQYVLNLSESVIVDDLKKAIKYITDNVPSLRNKFFFNDQEIMLQQATSYYEEPLTETNESVNGLLTRDGKTTFKLDEGKLIRFYLVHDEVDSLVITYHHILLDGWSVSLLIEQLLTVVGQINSGTGLLKNNNGSLNEQRAINTVRASVLPESKSYWHGQVDKLISYSQVSDKNPVADSTSIVSNELSEEFMSRITKFAKSKHISLSSVFFAAYLLAIKDRHNGRGINIGITTSGRQNLNVNEVKAMTCLINTLPVPVDLERLNKGNAIEIGSKCFESINMYGDMSLNELQGMCTRITQKPLDLFSDVFVFQNYPINLENGVAKKVNGINSFSGINFGSTFIANPNYSGKFEIGFMCEYESKELYEGMLEVIVQNIETLMSKNPSLITNDLESKIELIWKEILNIKDLDVNTNFFELGGDSIASLRISLKLKKMGLRVAPDTVFKYPTVNKLVHFLQEVE